MDEWLTTYRGYSDSELTEEIDWLRVQSRQPFDQQTEGTRAWTRNSAEIRNRLSAATMVRGERSGTSPVTLQADFSKVSIGSNPLRRSW